MLQRNETSMRSLYRPLSLSRMASPNHCLSTNGPPQQPEQHRARAPVMAVDPLARAQDHQEQAEWRPSPDAARGRNEVVRRVALMSSLPTCCSLSSNCAVLLLDQFSDQPHRCDHPLAPSTTSTDHEHRRADDARHDQVHRVELRSHPSRSRPTCAPRRTTRPPRAASAQKRPLALHRLLEVLARLQVIGHRRVLIVRCRSGSRRLPSRAGAAACALPPRTSKKVYDSVMVRTSFGIFGSMTNTTGHCLLSPGFSVYSLKQKHSSLLKCGVACLGA